jgi:hypothetical protein
LHRKDSYDSNCYIVSQEPSGILGKGMSGVFDLAIPSALTQLCNELHHLEDTGRPNGMAARDQSPARVYWQSTTDCSSTTCDKPMTFALRCETKMFALLDLGGSGGIMHFGEIDVLRANS